MGVSVFSFKVSSFNFFDFFETEIGENPWNL